MQNKSSKFAAKVYDKTLYELTSDAYVEYGSYINTNRHIPYLLDGLKPVYRRTILSGLKLKGKKSKTTQVAATTVDNWHPHGDCLHGDTFIYTTDGQIRTIRELYKSNNHEIEVYSSDTKGYLRKTITTHIRKGQRTNEYVEITINNRYVLKVTKNHPIQVIRKLSFETDPNQFRGGVDTQLVLRYIKAENLTKGARLYSMRIAGQTGWSYKDQDINLLTHFHPNKDLMYQLNGNTYDMSTKNLLTYKYVDKGRHTELCSNNDGELDPQAILIKKLLAKNSNLLRFFEILTVMKECQITLDEKSYIYYTTLLDNNSPRLKTLFNTYQRSFQSLLDLWRAYEILGVEDFLVKILHPGVLFETAKLSQPSIRSEGLEFTPETLRLLEGKGEFVVTNVKLVKLKTKTTFYDFTNEECKSMFIPLNNDLDNLKLISVHNSSVTPVISNLVRWGVFDGQGNIGGVPPLYGSVRDAAPRYTEVSINKMWDDLISELLYLVPTFDNEVGTKEPYYIPFPLPILPIYGGSGIGIGCLVNIPAFTKESMLEAYLNDDYRLLKLNYGYTLESGDLKSLWEKGHGKLSFSFPYEEDFDSIIVKGAPELSSIKFKEINKYIDAGKLTQTDISDKEGNKLLFRRQYNIKSISTDEVKLLIKKAIKSSKYYNMLIHYNNTVFKIGLRDWIDITYKNYLSLLSQHLVLQKKKIEEKLLINRYTTQVADKLLRTSLTEEEIANELNIDLKVVLEIGKKSITTLRSKSAEIDSKRLKNELKTLANFNKETYVYKLINGEAQ